ncbi:MAG TPA: RusA family crossover junction endodeoxyribonuclease [Caproiciproducens sp.]|nr:RusA family crossover junction endodeoxyribonuclease [Caproiciproducens sp.]
MKSVRFTIPGPPVGKARPKVVRLKNGFSHTYTPDKTVSYEELTRYRYMAAARGFKFSPEAQLCIQITACFPVPTSKSKRVKADMLSGQIKPAKKPDCDNIVKIICDALNGFAYKDDAQIVLAQIGKEYAEDGHTAVKIWEI